MSKVATILWTFLWLHSLAVLRLELENPIESVSVKAANPLLPEIPLSPLSDAPAELTPDPDPFVAVDDLPDEELLEELDPLPDPDPLPLAEPLFLLAMNCPCDDALHFTPFRFAMCF